MAPCPSSKPDPSTPPSPMRSLPPRPATPSCSRRRAPASTSSAVSSTAAKPLNRSSARCRPRNNMAQRLKTDWILFAAVLFLVTLGLVILYSASSIMANVDPRFGWSWHFVARQMGWAVASVLLMMFLKRTSYRKLNNPALAFSAISIALLLLAAVYFVDGHHRWLRFGPVGIQPSEVAKPALVVFSAFFVAWRGRAINHARHTLVPAALAVGFVIFAVVVADLGTAVVLALAAMTVFFVAGLELRYCAIAAGIAFLGLCISIYREPYRLARVVHFFDPQFKIL